MCVSSWPADNPRNKHPSPRVDNIKLRSAAKRKKCQGAAWNLWWGVGEASTWCIPLILAVRLDGRGTVEVAWQGKGKCGTTRNRNPRKLKPPGNTAAFISLSKKLKAAGGWRSRICSIPISKGKVPASSLRVPLPPPLLPPSPHSPPFFTPVPDTLTTCF